MKNKVLILLLAVPLFFACRSRSNFEGRSVSREAKSMTAEMEMADQASPPPPPAALQEPSANIDKKIIKTAYISIEVLNYADSRKLIDSALKEFSAYIVNENLQNTESQISNSLNIRVPANQFDKLLAKLSKIAKKVDYQNIEMKDVTEEYIDVATRLSNSRKVEQTYLRLLRKTTTIEDILKIEQKLGEIRTDIESTEGRLKYLNNQVNYSTINLNVYQTLDFRYVPDKLPGFFQQLKRSLDSGWRGIIVFLLFLIKLWPLWLIAAIGWYGWKYFIRHRKQLKKENKKRKKMLKREEQANANSEQ